MPLDNLPVPGAAAPTPAPQEAAPVQVPPPFSDVVAGTVPAVAVPPIHKDTEPDPVQSFVIQNLDTLTKAGLDYFEASNATTVVFNPAKISEAQLAKADKAGKLNEVAPIAALPQGAAGAPAEGAPAPEAAPLAPVQAPAAPAGVGRTRLANVQPPGPGIKPNPVPGQLAKRAL